jgi:hypothetical protein
MKILMISYNQVGQGTFLRIYEFARELVKRGQQVTIMATSKNKQFGIKNWEENGIKIVTFPSLFKSGPRFGWDPYSIILRIKWVNSKNFDLVHGFESRPTVIYPALWLMNKGVPLVLDWCDWFGKGGSVEERPNQIFRYFFDLLRPSMKIIFGGNLISQQSFAVHFINVLLILVSNLRKFH